MKVRNVSAGAIHYTDADGQPAVLEPGEEGNLPAGVVNALLKNEADLVEKVTKA